MRKRKKENGTLEKSRDRPTKAHNQKGKKSSDWRRTQKGDWVTLQLRGNCVRNRNRKIRTKGKQAEVPWEQMQTA